VVLACCLLRALCLSPATAHAASAAPAPDPAHTVIVTDDAPQSMAPALQSILESEVVSNDLEDPAEIAAAVVGGAVDQRFADFTDHHVLADAGARWFRADILSRSEQDQHLLLLLDIIYFQTIDVFFVTADKQVTHYQSGLGFPYSARPIDYSRYAFPVPFVQTPVTMYMRVTVNTNMVFEPRVMTTMQFARHASIRNAWSTLFIGAIAMVAFYALVIGLLADRLRESLFFQGIMISSVLLLLHFSGFLAQWLDPWPDFHRNLGRSLGSASVALHLLLFRDLFDFNVRYPRFSKILLAGAGMMIALTLVTLVLGPATLGSINRLATQISAMAIMGVSFWLIFKRIPYALLYGLSIVANTVGGLLFSLALEGGIDSAWLAAHGLEVGLLMLGLFYALLLATRLRDERLYRSQLRAENEIALAESRAKSDFLAVMSHEIRTPMNGVLGMAELLKGTELNDTQRYYTDAISTSGRTLVAVINDILDFSRVEAGQLHLDSVPFALDQVLDDSVMPYRFGSFPNVTMLTSIAPDVPLRLVGDPLRLQQVIVNLLSNAFKFTRQGEVVLRVESIETDALRARLLFSVRDSGTGIAEDLLPRLFNPFQQAETGTSRKYGGSGLGLAICKRLVAMMGGDIAAKNISASTGIGSAQGNVVQGASFEFTVSLLRDLSGPKPVPAPASLKGLTVLMVDDHPSYQQVFSEQVRYLGLELICALDAATALAVVRKGVRPGLIVLDKDMPNMDGISLARSLREMPALAEVPILLLTSSSGLPEASLLQQAGIQLASVKPVSVQQLQAIILDAMSPVQGRKGGIGDQREVDLTGMRVLVAEDNPVNRQVVRGLLTRLHVTTDIVEGGLAAVEKAIGADCSYDVVLMDCEMPDIDGYTATRRIREYESATGRRRLPIVALTAHALAEFVERSINAGMDGHLSKPIDVDKLQSALARFYLHPKEE
jgi:signal transduction histidine kinase/CheY-like chemotaxis protein